VTLAPVTGLASLTGQYRLTASNRCGDTPAFAEFSMRRIPQLSIGRIEVVQSTQTPTNTVPLVTNRRTAVRVFVDSGISDGFDFGTGLGPNRVGNLHATLVAENLDTGAVFDCGYPWGGPRLAGPALDRDTLGDSINFDVPLAACDGNVQFRATVTQPGPPASSSAAPASGSVTVSFAPLGKQEFLPFLVTDPSSALPTPTMGGFYSCLAGPNRPIRSRTTASPSTRRWPTPSGQPSRCVSPPTGPGSSCGSPRCSSSSRRSRWAACGWRSCHRIRPSTGAA
jgi:hypothetical protein